MSDNCFHVWIYPLKHYCKYAVEPYTLCGIEFDVRSRGQSYRFASECNDACLNELISAIDRFADGQMTESEELRFPVPWIAGETVVYRYSFRLNAKKGFGIFRWKEEQFASKYDFTCRMSKSEVLSMREQLLEQRATLDLDSLGKIPLYVFDLPDKDCTQYTSAGQLQKALDMLCVGKTIKALYVSAQNYAEPLSAKPNRVDCHLSPDLYVRLEDKLIQIRICGFGLFQMRVFEGTDVSTAVPRYDFIRDAGNEFCDIRELFTIRYADSKIEKVTVDGTADYYLAPADLDPSKLGDPIELPCKVTLLLENGNRLSMHGGEEDFTVSAEHGGT